MIYTLTLNPAFDYAFWADKIESGKTNRSVCEEITFGGKGINVSYVLNQLGVENKALGYVAGFTGTYLEQLVRRQGINTDFITLSRG